MSAYLSLAPIIQATQAENRSASPEAPLLDTGASPKPSSSGPRHTDKAGVARLGRRRMRHILQTDIWTGRAPRPAR